jgi:hypothetical protein
MSFSFYYPPPKVPLTDGREKSRHLLGDDGKRLLECGDSSSLSFASPAALKKAAFKRRTPKADLATPMFGLLLAPQSTVAKSTD